ncbi:hypothetical protein [Cerasicoccus arenae]|uniref:Uncharacterized protein n=1 Tax=Cerasicoccus arenae TaxID=424488 RepID=A0A8J3D908_9BACT|nr:hypothetical protein [Cerasicoccus arenae]MBK1859104.1 hypothetical protein [Cerasicoccus arenae]GHB91788.1 hypothetical protein GCM10007047_03350 [Cerasicoccus arenae]
MIAPRIFSSRVLILAPLIALAPSLSHAALDEARESLLRNSPFVQWQPPRQEIKAPPAVAPVGNLSREVDFKGILKIEDETFINLFDKVENRSVLLGLNESKDSARFKVVSYNSEGDRSIVLQAGNGQKETIYLASSDGVSIPTATAQPARPTSPQTIGVDRTTPAILNRTSSEPNTNRRRRVIPRRVNSNSGG